MYVLLIIIIHYTHRLQINGSHLSLLSLLLSISLLIFYVTENARTEQKRPEIMAIVIYCATLAFFSQSRCWCFLIFIHLLVKYGNGK